MERRKELKYCPWCGNELPPYEEWKFVLCPECEEEVKRSEQEDLE